MATFGDMIKTARKTAGLSQQKLGQQLACGQTAISGWEQNHARPGFATIIALSETLGVDVGDLARAAAVPLESPRSRPAVPEPAPF